MEITEQLIAKRIRELRAQRRLTLQDVSERARFSKSFLSKLERGKVSMSVATLSRLCNALGVPLGELFGTFEPDRQVLYVPVSERRSVSGRHGHLPYHYEVLVPRRGYRLMQPVMVSIDGRKTRFELREHPGEQFVLMLAGEMNYVCANRKYTLKPGDCLYFDARLPHGPEVSRNQKVRYLAVMTVDNDNALRRRR